jgi:hypothetical protein
MIPRNFRYSGLVLLLTTIETALLELCRELRDSRSLPLAVSDLSARPIHIRALKYLQKVAGVEVPASRFRQTLKDLVIVRNCIVHAAGNVNLMREPSPQKVRAAVMRLDGINLSANDYVEIEKDVCTHLVREARTWLDRMTTG